MPNNGSDNGLLYTDKRVLVSLGMLTTKRDQEANPIRQQEIAAHALVSPRTAQTCLGRLQEAGLIAMVGGGRGVSPLYVITDDGAEMLEAYK